MTFTPTRRVLLAASLVFAGSGAAAFAAPEHFAVQMTGAQQVPPVQTSGSGTADLTYNPSSRVVTWSVHTSGLSSPVTMSHFHGPAQPGQSAPPVIWLTKKGATSIPDPITGHAKLTPSQAKQFLAGDWYVNVHTKDNPEGEIRGQVVPPQS
jgi:hypothetical protein